MRCLGVGELQSFRDFENVWESKLRVVVTPFGIACIFSDVMPTNTPLQRIREIAAEHVHVPMECLRLQSQRLPSASNGDMSFVAVLQTRVFAKFLLRCGDVVVGIPQAEAHMDPCITLQGAFEAFNGTVGLGRRLMMG